MKRKIEEAAIGHRVLAFAVAVCALLTGVAAKSGDDLAGLKIYVFDVGQAMSQLWVYPSGYTVLVDCPELHWNSGSEAQIIAEKLQSILGDRKQIDVGVMTHLHLDHLGYAGKGGFWSLIENHGFSFRKFIERDSGYWVDKNGDGNCTPEELVYNNVGTLSGTATHWLCYATDPKNAISRVRTTAKLCSNQQIAPPDWLATVTIVAADAAGVRTKRGELVTGDHRADELPPSENDYSLGLVATYGNFTFATFGDLDGEYATSEFGYEYNNVEASVIKRLGGADVYNVNHHGSSHSSNAAFLKALLPSVSIISCGKNNTYGHPAQPVLDRLQAINSTVLLTEDGNPKAEYGRALVTNHDIVITVSADTRTYTVESGDFYAKFVSKGAKQPRCEV